MNLKIPIYIEQQPQGERSSIYHVRPLFVDGPTGRDEELSRAIAKFVRAMRKLLDKMGKELDQSRIADYGFAPEIEEQTLSFSLDLKEHKGNCRFLFVTFHALDRRIAFTPTLEDLWFEIERGETLQNRAAEVLTEYFRNRDKRAGPYVPKPAEISLTGKAETSFVEIEYSPPMVAQTPREDIRARLFADEQMDGGMELQEVGRCLNDLYPDELGRASGRDAEVEELRRLLKSSSHRPVLLIGRRMAGKTAIVEEYAYRQTARRKSPYKNRKNLWLLSPQRLISGMSYVGQWENRLLAILKEARKRNHILYFDDLLGMFKAGISASSNLNVAQVLKPYIERREIRVLGEITPEAWRVLREQDRGFADLFHLLPVPEPGEGETYEMMIGLIRQLEAQYQCQFLLDALPAVMSLQRRYAREAAFPGKAAAFLRQLAIKYRGALISHTNVHSEFQAKTGLSMEFLTSEKFNVSELKEQLSRSVIGQSKAVEACADAMITARARLNDPERPLACFLFLGPTGVGKTQCAKSLARVMFDSDERMIRFDMNEFVNYDSVARLVGTFDKPEGLLTSAIRRQPFSVILLDEIEKAHRDTFNLLLQVMGEGRLTDAIGRTADFTNAILILTSNLGAKEAAANLGFGNQKGNDASIYTQAAEKFFSPEFFNRLDRIVPFNRLNREAVTEIAKAQIWSLLGREGLRQRRGVLRLDDLALKRIIDAGFHPQLGARALKRTLEKELTQPVAARFAAMSWTTPIVIEVLPGPERLQIEVREILDTEEKYPSIHEAIDGDSPAAIQRIRRFLARIDERLDEMRPEGPISTDSVAPLHQRYFALKERVRDLGERIHHISNELEYKSRQSRRLSTARVRKSPVQEGKADRKMNAPPRRIWKEIFATEDMHAYLREAASSQTSNRGPIGEKIIAAFREASLIEMLARGAEAPTMERALLVLRPLQPGCSMLIEKMMENYEDLFGRIFGLEIKVLARQKSFSRRTDSWALISGWHAARIASAEAGTHALIEGSEFMMPIQVKVFPLAEGQRPREALKARLLDRIRWRREVAAGRASTDSDPWTIDPVIRIYHEEEAEIKTTFDLRSGISLPRLADAEMLSAFVASSLDLPPELTGT
ncbi:MAG: AAA family ATPase [Blastocatellia bacterium]